MEQLLCYGHHSVLAIVLTMIDRNSKMPTIAIGNHVSSSIASSGKEDISLKVIMQI